MSIGDIFGGGAALAGLFGGGGDAGKAAGMQARAIQEAARLESQGFFREADAIKRAAGIQATAARGAGLAGEIAGMRGIQGVTRGFQESERQFDPFLSAGRFGLEEVQGASTISGLNERLGQIFDMDQFGNLVDKRTQAVQGQLAAGGLTRSGAALLEAARVPTELGLGIERQQFGRSAGLAELGFRATTGLAGLREQKERNIAELQAQRAQAQAFGLTGEAGFQAEGIRGFAGAQRQGFGAQARGLAGAGAAQASGIFAGQQADANRAGQLFGFGSRLLSRPGGAFGPEASQQALNTFF